MPGTDAASSPAADDDLTLARRVAHGDRAAFEWLMRRHNRRLFRLAPCFGHELE
jgi:hypothetical protein